MTEMTHHSGMGGVFTVTGSGDRIKVTVKKTDLETVNALITKSQLLIKVSFDM